MEGKIRVAIYARTSTSDGRQEVENQLSELRRFAAAQDWAITHEFIDQESGNRADRVQFRQLFAVGAQRQFDLLLFWALDRLTREGALATLKYLEQFEQYGIHWRSFTEPWIDSAGPFRDVIVSLLASLAKQERIRISERVRAGLNRIRTQGTKSGRPVGRPRVILDSYRVVELRNQSFSWRQIAKALGAKVGTIRRSYAAATKGQPVAVTNGEAL